jgi:hypothetical protein
MASGNSKEGSSSPCDTPPLSSAGMSKELQPKKEGEATFTVLQTSEDYPQNPYDHWLDPKKPLTAAGDKGLLEKNILET